MLTKLEINSPAPGTSDLQSSLTRQKGENLAITLLPLSQETLPLLDSDRLNMVSDLSMRWLIPTFFCLASVMAVPYREHTPLLNEMPCMAQNLKVRKTWMIDGNIFYSLGSCFQQETDHYICSEDHKMICLNGWSEPENQCRTPVCQFITAVDEDGEAVDSKTCSEHGECVRPDVCACEVGLDHNLPT